MPIISVEIMKTIDQREKQRTTKEKQRKTKRRKGNRSYSERVRAKWFCCSFNLGFFQLTCKAYLIFKSNLELALSIISKQRELYESKHVTKECYGGCSKIWDLLSFLICSFLSSSRFKFIQFFSFSLHHRFILFLTVNFIIKSME